MKNRLEPGMRRAVQVSRAHLTVHWREWAVGAAAAVLGIAIIGLAVNVRPRHSAEAIRLQALDQKGRLEIRWNPEADAIRGATDARLFITDGVQKIFVKLSPSRLHRGVVSYGRQSDHVYLRMALSEPGGTVVEERASFVGAPPVSSSSPQLEARVDPQKPTPFGTEPVKSGGVAEAAAAPVIAPVEHRARKGPVVASGTQLPFTCSAGDVFRKTDAPRGFDTFACRGRNVWSLVGNQTRDDRSNIKPNPNAATPTAKPAIASTT